MIVLLTLGGVAYVQSGPLSERVSRLYVGRMKPASISFVLCADPGDYIGGFGEASVLLAAASDVRPDPHAADLLCPSVHRLALGTHKKHEIVLATTGIGATRAALCMDSLLRAYGPAVKEIIYIGTAGGSPAIGGVIDSDRCDAPAHAADAKVEDLAQRLVKLGDVCVSPFATNWDCQRCQWASEPYASRSSGAGVRSASACAAAPCSLHERWDLFGDVGCEYFTSTELADELIEAAAFASRDRDSVLDRPAPSGIARAEREYWTALADGSDAPLWKEAQQKASSTRGATVHGYQVCSEATSYTFWQGAPYDELARGYIAQLINKARDFEHVPDINVSRSDVLAISAMEGTGWMSVLAISEEYLGFSHVPTVNVRGVADYTHDPLVRDADGTWLENPDWLTHQEQLNATRDGYRYAIETTSAVVLSLFQRRDHSDRD